MSTVEFITVLFFEVDEQLRAIPKHPEAHLWPSEVVTLGLLHALKGVGNRPFYRWLTRDYRALFPRLPERTRLFRLLNADFRSAKSINIFGFSREAHGYWKTTGRFRNHGITWLGWSRAASRKIGLWQRLSKCTTSRSG